MKFTTTSSALAIVLFLCALALPALANDYNPTPEQLRKNQNRASFYLSMGYSFNPKTTSAAQMDDTVRRGQRAKYWKQRGYDFDPEQLTPEQMDYKAGAYLRAKYWARHGYEFDPETMSAAQMNLYVFERDPEAYWKRLGIQYDARLLDKTKIQLQDAARQGPPADSHKRSTNQTSPLDLQRGYSSQNPLAPNNPNLTLPPPPPTSPSSLTPEQRLEQIRAQREGRTTIDTTPFSSPSTISLTPAQRLQKIRDERENRSASLRSRQMIHEREAERTRVSTPATRLQDQREARTGRVTPPGQRVTVHTSFPKTYNERRDNPARGAGASQPTTVRATTQPFNARRDLRDAATKRASSNTNPAPSTLAPANARRASRDNGN
jgi:hypothetical protein